MMINSLKLQFDPKNIKHGLDLTKCSTPTAYLNMSKSHIVIQDCNMSFASLLLVSKTKLKNTDLIKYIPGSLHLSIIKSFKKMKVTDKVQEVGMFFLRKGFDLTQFNASIRTIKISEEKKLFAIQLNQNKHVYSYGLGIHQK
jgi:hypothetical protein